AATAATATPSGGRPAPALWFGPGRSEVSPAMATLIPRAASAASTSSGAGGSPSRRRRPNTVNAIADTTTPPVVASVGARARAGKVGPFRPKAARAFEKGPQVPPDPWPPDPGPPPADP